MATKGKIQVIQAVRNGEFLVQATDHASVQLLVEAIGKIDGLKIQANWPRRRGGSEYPDLKLTKGGA